MMPPSEKRPALLLWLMSRITLIIFPLSISINLILVKYGMTEDLLTFALAALIATKVVGWYESLNDEVTEYIRNKYGA